MTPTSIAWLDDLTTYAPTNAGPLPGMTRGGKYVLLEDVRAALAVQVAPAESGDLHREMLATLEHVESVYRQNCIAPGEPSSTLDNLQRMIAKASAALDNARPAAATSPASRFVVTDMGYCNRTNECECAPEAMRGCVSWVAAATSLEPAKARNHLIGALQVFRKRGAHHDSAEGQRDMEKALAAVDAYVAALAVPAPALAEPVGGVEAATEWLEGEAFYAAMRRYRLAPGDDRREVVAQFENVKRLIRAELASRSPAVEPAEIDRLRSALHELWATQDPAAWDDDFAADVKRMVRAAALKEPT